jgi:hypothetical protein
MVRDTMKPLAQQAAGRYSDAFLRAIDRALAVKPADRPQNVAAFRSLLGLGAGSTAATPAIGARPLKSKGPPSLSGKSASKTWIIGGFATLAALAIGGHFLTKLPKPTPMAEVPEGIPAPTSEPVAAPPPEFPALPAPHPFVALDEIDRIYQQRNRDHSVTVELEKAQVRIGHDRLSFRVRSSRSGYLYVLMVGTDKQHFYKLFPNAVDAQNRVQAGKDVWLPRAGWAMVAGGPAGANQFVAVVSENPRDFAATRLVAVDPFAEFPLDTAATLAARVIGTQSPLLGKPVCPSGNRVCSDAYGAAVFTIEEID